MYRNRTGPAAYIKMLFAITLVAVFSSALGEYQDYDHYPSEHDGYSQYDHHQHEKKYHGPPAPLKHDGTVDYTPEVKHARAAHFAALKAYSATFPGQSHHGYHGEYHHSPIPFAHFYNPNPAPVKPDGSVDDLPEVKAARAHHLAQYHQTLHRYRRSYNPHDSYYHGHKYVEPAPLNHDGTVADTDAIKHAKAVLARAHNEAKSRLHGVGHYYHGDDHSDHSYDHYEKKYHGPPAPLNHDGTVAETDEVKHAKAIHFQLYNQALHRYRRAIPFQPAPLNPDGTVAETPEVQQAKAAFMAAYSAEAAQADHSWVEPEHHDEPRYNNYVEPIHYEYSQPSFSPSKPIYEEPEHHAPLALFTPKNFEPAPLNHDGTVADTPAIKQAKAIHFAAYKTAKVSYPHSYIPQPHSYTPPKKAFSHSPAPSFSNYKKPVIPAPLNHDGTVADTPEIQAAKAIHFQAHQEAFARAPSPKFSQYNF